MNLEKLRKDINVFKAINNIKNDGDFAAMIGVTKQTFSTWLKGRQGISEMSWVKIEKVTKGEIKRGNYE